MTNLFDPPPIYDLPLVKGQDLVVDFKNKVPGSKPVQYVNYPSDTTVSLIIDPADPAGAPIVAAAIITAEHAVCRVESEDSDPLDKGLLWRCAVTIAGSPPTDRVPVNGTTVRYDGKVAR